MSKTEHEVEEYSLKSYIIPFTSGKAIFWIIIIGFIVYANMLFNPFVWDDKFYILVNPVVQNFNVSAFFGNNVFNNAGQYRPLTVAYFSALYSLFNTNQFFYHLIQLSLHMTNTVLIFIIFKQFFKLKLAFFLSLLFLVHPLQVESISYIAASASPLFFLLGISALLLNNICKKSYIRYELQFLLLLGAMLIKESGILFIFLIVIHQYLFNKTKTLHLLVLSFLSIVVYLMIRYFIGGIDFTSRPLIPIAQLTFSERIYTIPEVLLYYIKSFFFPVTLAINQHWVITEPTISQFYIPLTIIILIFVTIIVYGVLLNKKKSSNLSAYIFFVLWTLLGLGLHSQLIPLDMTVADRWAYFGIAGMLGIVGVLYQEFNFTPIKNNHKLVLYLAILIVILFATRTIVRNTDWYDTVYLWKQAISVDDNFLSQQELALTLTDKGKYDEALIAAKTSVSHFPNDNNLYNLGFIYEKLGKTKDAERVYYQAYKAKHYVPWEHRHYIVVYARLAIVLIHHQKYEAAKSVLIEGIKDYPDDPILWANLAASEYKLGNKDKALIAVNKAIQLSPQSMQIVNLYERIRNNLPIDLQYSL